MRSLEKGSGVAFSVMGEKEEIIHFQLAVIAKKNFRNEEEFEFAFISDLGYVESCHSGGNTGFGIDFKYSIKSLKSDNIRIVTTDLEEIKRLAGESEQKAREEREKFYLNQKRRAEEINKLSRFYEINSGIPKIDERSIIKISDHEFRRGYSNSIQGYVGFESKSEEGLGKWCFDLFDFEKGPRHNKSWRIKDFLEYLGLEDTKENRKLAREKLEQIKGRFNEVKEMVKKIKREDFVD